MYYVTSSKKPSFRVPYASLEWQDVISLAHSSIIMLIIQSLNPTQKETRSSRIWYRGTAVLLYPTKPRERAESAWRHMHLPELGDVWIFDLSCFVIVGRVADFFLEHFPAVAVAQVFHESLADFDVLVDTLVRVDGRARRPGEKRRLNQWRIGDGRMGGAL